MDVEMLSRIQFAFTLTFHYIYPPLSIGLGLALIMMEGMFLKTRNKAWEKLTKFWLKVFALTFALGVGTGIPLQFSLGTNWSRYSRFVGDVFGSVIGAEGFFAFMVEAGFLGVLLFGWNRVSSRVHFFSTIMVALGAHFSAIWIVSANSWMHTPAGFRLVTEPDGTVVAQVTDWWTMFLNPSNLSHITHVLLSAWMSGGFLIVSVAAFYLIKKTHYDFAIKSMKVGVIIVAFSTMLQLVSADHLAGKVAKYNPEKFAALEGVYETKPFTPAYLWGWVDNDAKKTYGLYVPGFLSFLSYRDFKTPVPGLDQFPRETWPYVPAVFQVYHIMIIMWILMFIASIMGVVMWKKNRWRLKNWMMRFLVLSVLFPQIANISGWFTSCMGRQPWTVYKLLKTKEAFSANLTLGQMIGSLTMFVVMYLLFFGLFLYLLDIKIRNGPYVEDEQLAYRDPFKESEHV
jgi:cytochrome d ubiquinol oxidase subunit I